MTRALLAWTCVLWLLPGSLRAQATGATLTLSQALATAHAHAPELRRARAESEAASARVDVAGAALLPQISAGASYQRGTANSAASELLPGHSNFDLRDAWSFDLRAAQLIYDFGQTVGERKATQATAQARRQSERVSLRAIERDVRLAYFDAAAQRRLLEIARKTLANQQQHLGHVQAFVEVGTRPAIDLAQIKTDVASAKLRVVRADNAYALAKATLARAMGTPGPGAFDVSDELPPAVDNEDAAVFALVEQARKARPELAVFAAQVRAQEHSIGAIEGGYGPSLSVGTGASESGARLSDLSWNWQAGVTLSWPIFQGGVTNARAREARAVLAGLRAELEAFDKDLQLALERARLNVHGAREALLAADEVIVSAQERRALATERYAAGAGNIIELQDAELALETALADRATAEYELATARAALLYVLGR
jgi:outer membrane protein